MKKWQLELRRLLGTMILVGLVGALIAFVWAASEPEEYLVVGKMVVFPGSCENAPKNLGYEVGNTIAIIESTAFREFYFGDQDENFESARQMNVSSTIEISFLATQEEVAMVEDAIVRIPEAVFEYTRDVYEGSPFKYRLLSDPEMSVSPVRPNQIAYVLGGFAAGAGLFLLYSILGFFMKVPPRPKEEPSPEPAEPSPTPEKMVAPSMKLEEETLEAPKVRTAPREKKEMKPETEAPSNLPVTEGRIEEAKPVPQYEEPSDEEVRERLNRLMKGEL